MTRKTGQLTTNQNRILGAVTGILIYAILTGAMLHFMPFRKGGSAVVYPLDDAYIYMSMARNIADFGVWGVTPHNFSGTSSAHIWVLFLALAYKLFGAQEVIPLVMNIGFGVASIVCLALAARDMRLSKGQLAAVLFAFLFGVYPSQLTVIGMETVLSCLLTIGFIWSSIRLLSLKEAEKPSKSLVLWSSLSTMLLAGCRYESLFLIGPVVLALFLKKQHLNSLLILASASLPVLAYGIYSISHDGLFFPNTILLKGRVGFTDPIQGVFLQQIDVGKTAIKQLWLMGTMVLYFAYSAIKTEAGATRKNIYLALAWLTTIATVLGIEPVLNLVGESLSAEARAILETISCEAVFCLALGAALVALAKLRHSIKEKDYDKPLFDILILASMAHLFAARFGWLFRYEAYLLTVMSMLYIPLLSPLWTERKEISRACRAAILSGLALLIFGLSVRFCLGSYITPKHAWGIRYQHLEMAKFIQEYFPKGRILAIDIGAITYFCKDITLLDLWGLDSLEVARARAKQALVPDFLVRFARKERAEIGVLQEPFFKPHGLPHSWVKVAVWHTPPAYNGIESVSFYAMDEEFARKLKEDLSRFELPSADRLEFMKSGL